MVDGGEPGVDSKDEGKHTGRNDLLFVEPHNTPYLHSHILYETIFHIARITVHDVMIPSYFYISRRFLYHQIFSHHLSLSQTVFSTC